MRRIETSGLIVRQKSPLNLEFPFSTLSDWLIPTEHFFVRNHFPIPKLLGTDWTLRIEGAVHTPLEFSLDELKTLPSTSLPAVMECAGNGRVFYEPVREGLQWQNGAVSNASWTGVLLRDVLEKAGIQREACEVVLMGADRGVVDGGKKTASPGPIAFARSLPLPKALDDSVLLAYAMNDAPLTAEHGYPLRAVVGGWYGMAWVKWLTHIQLVERPFQGYWQARDYFRWDRSLGEPSLIPLAEMAVKAQIARPVNGASVRVGQPCQIFGAAWSGEGELQEVQVCTQGGTQWQQATLLPPKTRYAWQFFEYEWTPPEPGSYTLVCRAIDRNGNVQPAVQQPDRESYMANWSIPVEVNAVVAPEMSADAFMI